MDIHSIAFSCDSLEGFSQAYGDVQLALSPDLREKFKDVVGDYLAIYGAQGAWERLNGRSVAQIISVYEPNKVKPVEAGELDGIRYKLYAPRPEGSADEQSYDGES